jgi:type II secretory ATPase GspE/PulE/Tfp pilus assembly ATPase PilB-like protein
LETSVETPAVGLVEELLDRAVSCDASDVHLDPTPGGLQVRMRTDGVLHRQKPLPSEYTAQIIGRLKALADLLAYRTDVPQEGRIAADRTAAGLELRIATYPTPYGERVALRLDTAEGSSRLLEELGLSQPIEQDLRTALAQPDGVLLLTGPSGSGKTTTLYSCLGEIVQQGISRSIVTIEDPIERRIEGVTQTAINPIAGLDFSRALRSLLRQDPDVLLIGEIRDRETAAIALEAGLTGHLVASTVHAGTATMVFARLLEMGVEPFTLTSVVRGVLAQRLLRRRCPKADRTHHGNDCSLCFGSGFSGRSLIAEWLPLSGSLREVVLARGDATDLQAAATQSGYRSLREEALAQVESGVTVLEEVNRVLGPA